MPSTTPASPARGSRAGSVGHTSVYAITAINVNALVSRPLVANSAHAIVAAPKIAAAGIGQRSSVSQPRRASSESEAKNVVAQLTANGVSHRLWYGEGLQASAYYAGCAADPLPVTKEVAPRVLGLPFATDLDERTVQRVAAAVESGVGRP